MNLKVPGAILPLCCAFLSTGAKTVWGLLLPPSGELGLSPLDVNWNECGIMVINFVMLIFKKPN